MQKTINPAGQPATESFIEYQECSARCLRCRRGRLVYQLTCKGPWLLEEDTVRCTDCGASHHFSLTVDANNKCTVTHQLLP